MLPINFCDYGNDSATTPPYTNAFPLRNLLKKPTHIQAHSSTLGFSDRQRPIKKPKELEFLPIL
jgi:hypothetical protein